ncbi:MAG: type I phosphomannose isomerase catalytic subunit [Rikenellaceae bacterium]
MLKPLKFKPIYKERIWGGTLLNEVYGRKLPVTKEPVGESWEISAVEGDESVVCSGMLEGNNLSELIEIYMDELVGESVYERFGGEFPLLIKLIDAQDNLSIQVHPDDELSAARHGAYGKTEMWYVLSAEEGATLYMGFKEQTTKEKYMEYLEAGKLEYLLASYEVKAGDTFFIPAGTIHAIGKGILIAEIQQTSDITYRVYDFNRVDSQGKSRELHTTLALDAIDYSVREDLVVTKTPVKNQRVEIQSCKYFASELLELEGRAEFNYSDRDSFTIFICLEGECVVSTEAGDETPLTKGESLLIPACLSSVNIEGSTRLISTWIPKAE